MTVDDMASQSSTSKGTRAQVAGGVAGNPPVVSPGTQPQDGEKRGQKRRGGAPKGNQSARKHGAYARDLHAGKNAARASRDRHRKKAEREARQILADFRLADDPWSKFLIRQVGRLEAMVYRLESHHSGRGYFTRQGDLKTSVSTEVAIIGKLLDEARRLLDKRREDPAAAGEVVHRHQITYFTAKPGEPRVPFDPPWKSDRELATAP